MPTTRRALFLFVLTVLSLVAIICIDKSTATLPDEPQSLNDASATATSGIKRRVFTECTIHKHKRDCADVFPNWPDKGAAPNRRAKLEPEQEAYLEKWQQPRDNKVEGLTAQPWHTKWAQDVGLAALLEERRPAITAEIVHLLGLQSYGGVFPRDGQGLSEGAAWKLYHFAYNGRRCTANYPACPATLQALNDVDALLKKLHGGGLWDMTLGLTTFSILDPGSHIAKHNGPNNLRIRCHLPLIEPLPSAEAAAMRVGDETHVWKIGQLMCFDDSFEHEAWNNGTSPRAILMFDIWHYDFTEKHIESIKSIFVPEDSDKGRGCGQIYGKGYAVMFKSVVDALLNNIWTLAIGFVLFVAIGRYLCHRKPAPSSRLHTQPLVHSNTATNPKEAKPSAPIEENKSK